MISQLQRNTQLPHTLPTPCPTAWDETSPVLAVGALLSLAVGGTPHIPHLGLCLDRAPCTPRMEPEKGFPLQSGGKFHPETLKVHFGCWGRGVSS